MRWSSNVSGIALKARSETARIAAGRELLDRGFGRARQSMEVSLPEKNIVRIMLDEIDARNREDDRRSALNWKLSGREESSAKESAVRAV